MPLWKIYHPKDAFTAEEKKGLAQAITDVYARGMPRFYVGVVYQEVASDSFYVGGEPTGNFVRFWVDHIARTLPNDEARRNFTKYIAKVVEPWLKDRDWELHVDETPFDLWTIQGHLPPRQGTEDEKRWISENRPSPRTHD
jgi:phenylpyruvate tautomerase PptA (4-oxalocrotonate tautomerase family)